MADKAKAMQSSMAAKKRINLISNEALIVGANANLNYLSAVKKALEGKEKSLQETQKTVQMKVDNGRLGAFELYKIDDALNQIAIAKNSIDIQMKTVSSSIESLTGISLDEPVEMQKVGDVSKNAFASLAPIRELIRANSLDVKAQKEMLYPALYAHGNYMFNQGEAYNTYDKVNNEYGDVGVTLNIPIFEMSQYDAISLAEVEVRSSEVQLQKSSDELSSKAKMLQSSLPLQQNSKTLYKKSIEDKQKILDIAKVNYTNGRLSTQDYLKYEDDVVSEEANLYQTEAALWQTMMQLAVIYANNIEEIVK